MMTDGSGVAIVADSLFFFAGKGADWLCLVSSSTKAMCAGAVAHMAFFCKTSGG